MCTNLSSVPAAAAGVKCFVYLRLDGVSALISTVLFFEPFRAFQFWRNRFVDFSADPMCMTRRAAESTTSPMLYALGPIRITLFSQFAIKFKACSTKLRNKIEICARFV